MAWSLIPETARIRKVDNRFLPLEAERHAAPRPSFLPDGDYTLRSGHGFMRTGLGSRAELTPIRPLFASHTLGVSGAGWPG